jgi:4'-phosphopantetheinyl transferase
MSAQSPLADKGSHAGAEREVIAWRRPSVLGPPGADEVHLWRLDLAAADTVSLAQTLDEGERARAERLIVPQARARFVAARGMLRATLASYTGESPATLRFRYGHAGKPYLDGPIDHGLSFNLAHSHDLALLAVAAGARVGVDLELVTGADGAVIADWLFASAERLALDALPPEQRRTAFYRCWACKEAFVKARGEGLGPGLEGFVVSVTPGAPAALLHVDGDQEEAGRWRLASLFPADGFVAALCVEGRADVPLWVSYLQAEMNQDMPA